MGSKKAVLIGCNYPGTDEELMGCVNDVWRVYNCLVQRFGFYDGDIQVLIDTDDDFQQPTGRNIRRAITDMVRSAKSGDVLFVHFSGHGTRLPSESKYDNTGYDECIVPTDTNLITDDDFRNFVNQVPKGCRITIVADSCHSGGLIANAKEQIGESTKSQWEYSHQGTFDSATHRHQHSYQRTSSSTNLSPRLSHESNSITRRHHHQYFDQGTSSSNHHISQFSHESNSIARRHRHQYSDQGASSSNHHISQPNSIARRHHHQYSNQGTSGSNHHIFQFSHKLNSIARPHRHQYFDQGTSSSKHHVSQFSRQVTSSSGHHRHQYSDQGTSSLKHHISQFSSQGTSSSGHHRQRYSNQRTSSSKHHISQFSHQGSSSSGRHHHQDSSLGHHHSQHSHQGTFGSTHYHSQHLVNRESQAGYRHQRTFKYKHLSLPKFIEMLKTKTGRHDIYEDNLRQSLFDIFGEDVSPKIKLVVNALNMAGNLAQGLGYNQVGEILNGIGNVAQNFLKLNLEDSSNQVTYAIGATNPTPPRRGILISACQSDQTAADDCRSGQPHEAFGALSNVIQIIIDETKAEVTNRTLVLKARQMLEKQGFTQRPGLYCSDYDADAPFLS